MESAAADDRSLRLYREDGLGLEVEVAGIATGTPLVFAHGFGQTRHMWWRIAAQLRDDGYRTFVFDARGHGTSDRARGGRYRVDDFLDDLGAVAGLAGGMQAPVLIGASMGGLIGLALAGEARPAPFSALVLIDVTPRWENPGVARIVDFMRAHATGFATLDEARSALARAAPGRAIGARPTWFRHGDEGRLHWHWDPAILESLAQDGARHQPRLLRAAGRIDVPILLVTGGQSDVVSDATLAEFQALAPHARHVKFADATHMLASDEPVALVAEIRRFLGASNQKRIA